MLAPYVLAMMTLAPLSARFAALPAPVRGAAYMLISTASFSVMGAIVRHLSTGLDPIQIVFFRNVLGLLFLLPWLIGGGIAALRTHRPLGHLLRGALGLTAMVCLFIGLSRLPLAEATALTFAAPLFATAGAALLLNEVVRIRRWAATIAGFLGVLIILRPGTAVFDPAALWPLAAALFMAAAVLMIKALSETERSETIVFWFGLIATTLSFFPALWVWETPTLEMWPALLALGLFATFGQVGLTRAFAATEASIVVPFDFSRLVFVSILGFLWFGERPDLGTWVGAAVIIAASAYIANRERRAQVPLAPEAPVPPPAAVPGPAALTKPEPGDRRVRSGGNRRGETE